MIQLQDSEIRKLSTITQTPPVILEKLIAMGLIAPNGALDLLLAYDYKRLKRRGYYTVGQIKTALSDKYKCSMSRVSKAAHASKKKVYYCDQCAKQITGREKKRGKGKCDQCVAKDMKI